MSRRVSIVLLAGCMAVSAAAAPRAVRALDAGVRGPYADGPAVRAHRIADSGARAERRASLAALRLARRSALQLAGLRPGL